MLTSAELRYFWKQLPPGLDQWYRGGISPGGGLTRIDEYWRDPSQMELGIKRRGEKPGVEIKGLVALGGKSVAVPFAGQIELWAKWSSPVLPLPAAGTTAIQKQRWLRKFDTAGNRPVEIPLQADESPVGSQPLPADGCNVELTKLALPSGDVWWTLGLEAFGSLSRVEKNLSSAIDALVSMAPPAFASGMVASYPAWLQSVEKGTA